MPELAFASWAVIVINALFSFFQEYKADKALTELANMLPSKVNVFRDGELRVTLAEDLTLGDLLVLEAGNSVPADARILESAGLNLDNSLLTGESISVGGTKEFDPNDKNITESTNLIFAGTTVTRGKSPGRCLCSWQPDRTRQSIQADSNDPERRKHPRNSSSKDR